MLGFILRLNTPRIPVEHHLHVVPDVRVPVLIDSEAGAGVEQLDVHDPDLRVELDLNNSSARNTPITPYFIAPVAGIEK